MRLIPLLPTLALVTGLTACTQLDLTNARPPSLSIGAGGDVVETDDFGTSVTLPTCPSGEAPTIPMLDVGNRYYLLVSGDVRPLTVTLIASSPAAIHSTNTRVPQVYAKLDAATLSGNWDGKTAWEITESYQELRGLRSVSYQVEPTSGATAIPILFTATTARDPSGVTRAESFTILFENEVC